MTPQRKTSAVLCFILFTLFYGWTARGRLQVSDEVATFATGISLATQGDLAIDELQWLQDAVNIGARGTDDHLYAKYFPGNVLSSAVLYLLAGPRTDPPYVWNGKDLAPSLARAEIAMRLNAGLGALGLTLLLLTISKLFDLRTAWVTVILVGLCSDWWYQSRGFLSEVGAGVLLIACAYFADDRRPFFSALSLGISLLFRPPAILGLPLWGLSVWKAENRRRAALSIVLVGAGAAALAAYNGIRFGSPTSTGYGTEGFSSDLLAGLQGLLLTPGRSLFVYSPVLLLALAGAVPLYRRHRPFAVAALASIAGYVIAMAAWHSWDGGWTWGSRLLTPILLLLGVLCAPSVERLWSDWRILVVIVALGAVGFGVQVVALARDPIRVLNEQVSGGRVPYDDTIYSLDRSWLALQVQSLSGWTPCDVDAQAIQALVDGCTP